LCVLYSEVDDFFSFFKKMQGLVFQSGYLLLNIRLFTRVMVSYPRVLISLHYVKTKV
jgi:hypothetical protein